METAVNQAEAGTISTSTASAPFEIRPLGDLMGVEVFGIDLAEPFDDDVRDAIMDALVEHKILCFRDQSLSKEQQYGFTARFGELEGHVVRNWAGEKSPPVHTVS
ncbi:MAG: TauD/TfdA family dioxygenase, partial [Pseudomonadota bacterium]